MSKGKERQPWDLGIPVVWNSSGYESVATLRRLEGLVQVFLPDYKYSLSPAADKYSAAPDYPQIAAAAISEMFRQVGHYVMGEDGLLQSGVLVRHLVLPGELENSRGVVDWFARTFAPGQAFFSLMSQYTPVAGGPQRPLTETEHRQMREYLEASGIEDGFCQDLCAATEEMVPKFNLTGVTGEQNGSGDVTLSGFVQSKTVTPNRKSTDDSASAPK